MKRLLATPLVTLGAVTAVVLAGAPAAYASSSTIVVKPGQSIQAAVDKAHPGDTIKLKKGTYSGGVLVQKNWLTIRGDGPKTVLVPGGTDHCAAAQSAGSGICVVGSPGFPVTGVSITSLTVHGFTSFGVIGFLTDRLSVTEVTAAMNGDYGITEFASTRGWFTDNWVLNNANDAGLYVGDIADAKGTVVADNHASGNALGVLVRHAHNVKVTGNWLTGNCTGVALVDDGQSGGQGNTWVSNNTLTRNNKVCPPHEGVPPLGGTGIVLVGGQHNTIVDNTIDGNRGTQPFSGGAVLEKGVSGTPASGNVIKDNDLDHNSPKDVIDHSGGSNTFRHNDCDTSTPSSICHH
jgi:nitrous oxidase accessory protein NosD